MLVYDTGSMSFTLCTLALQTSFERCTGFEFRFEHPGTPSCPNEFEPQATTWPDSIDEPRLHLVVSAHQKSLEITPATANVWFHPQAILVILGRLLIFNSWVTLSVESWLWPNWPLLFHPHEITSPSPGSISRLAIIKKCLTENTLVRRVGCPPPPAILTGQQAASCSIGVHSDGRSASSLCPRPSWP